MCVHLPSLTTHTHTLKYSQCLAFQPYLICGNGGSSDEGRDGGLCNHAVGGDTVRRGVEPDKGQTSVREFEKGVMVHKTSHYTKNDTVK